jgi:hypothetical protein
MSGNKELFSTMDESFKSKIKLGDEKAKFKIKLGDEKALEVSAK